jgi:hypothetical protein
MSYLVHILYHICLVHVWSCPQQIIDTRTASVYDAVAITPLALEGARMQHCGNYVGVRLRASDEARLNGLARVLGLNRCNVVRLLIQLCELRVSPERTLMPVATVDRLDAVPRHPPRGRRPKYDWDALNPEIARRLGQGVAVKSVAAQLKIVHSTLINHLVHHPELRPRMQEGLPLASEREAG